VTASLQPPLLALGPIVAALAEVNDAMLIDHIAARTQLPLSQIMADLTLLQIRGRVKKEWDGGVRLKK
jgi:predicted Rossmann fold nucleotide-binding protein DprA/Smf involved in DNA uptake